MRHAVSSGLRMMLMLNVPATLGLSVLATPIVALIFERGRFTPADTAATAAALVCYAPGPGRLLGRQARSRPAFYALGNSRMPVIASAASVALQRRAEPDAGAVARPSRPGAGHRHRGAAERRHSALAAARAAGRPRRRRLAHRRCARSRCASLAMAVAAYYAERLLHVPFAGDARDRRRRVRVFGAIGVGLVVLAVSAHLLRIEEFTELRRRVLRVLNVVDSTRCAATRRATVAFSYSFGPGPLSPAIKALIVANVAVFVVMWLMPHRPGSPFSNFSAWCPRRSSQSFRVWQPVTYMFLHGAIGHILFNMLALWMFGTELERMWGTQFFLRYYFVTGIAAAVTTIAVSLLPFRDDRAHVLLGDDRRLRRHLRPAARLRPDVSEPADLHVLRLSDSREVLRDDHGRHRAALRRWATAAAASRTSRTWAGWSPATSLLRGRRLSPANEVRYRYLRWKMDRARKKFGVYSGGQGRLGQARPLKVKKSKVQARTSYFLVPTCYLLTFRPPSPPIISASSAPTSGSPSHR